MNIRLLLLSFGLLVNVTGARAEALDVAAALRTRFEGDRTGACLVAARIDGPRVDRAAFCAGPRAGGPAPAPGAAFEIGSVTKTMTSFLVADLVAAGKWSLDDPIAAHLPPGTPVPRQGERQVLVRDLLTHTSGLPALPSRMGHADPGDPYAALTEADLLASLGDVQLTRPIGGQAAYSNFGMMVVSDAVARVYGTSYEAALKARLFGPLGMTGAFVATPAAGEPVAVGHTGRGTPTSAWTIAPDLAGVGMVKATLDDMVRYATAEMSDGPLAARLRLTQQPLAANFAMNWALAHVDGHDLLLHEGGTGGFSSFVGIDPARHVAVVILADTALTDLGGLGDVGLALLGTGAPIAPPRRATAVPATLLRAMPGDFELGSLKLHVRVDGVRLFAQATGQAEFELLADDHGDLHPSTFDALLTPALTNAQVDRFVWRQSGGAMEGVRAGVAGKPVAADRDLASDCEGSYRLTPQFSLRIFRAEGRVMLQGSGQPAFAVEVTGADRIEVESVGAVVKFNRDAKGAVVGATLLQGGAVLEGIRQ
jgi:CubicO group peptidase (beta-lactamase class C family)